MLPATFVNAITESLTGVSVNAFGHAPMPLRFMRKVMRYLLELGSFVVANSGVVFSEGSTHGNTAYHLDMTAGDVHLAGASDNLAAWTDQLIIGAGSPYAHVYDKAGATPVVLTATGKSRIATIVAALIDGTVTRVVLFGDEADDGAEVALTDTQIRTALATIEDCDTTCYIELAQVLYQFESGSPDATATTFTHDALKRTRGVALSGIDGAA